MNQRLSKYILPLLLATLTPGIAFAQQGEQPEQPEQPSEEKPAETGEQPAGEDQGADEEGDDSEGGEEAPEAKEGAEEVPAEPAPETKPAPKPEPEPKPEPVEEEPAFEAVPDSPISGLGQESDEDFVPLDDIEEDALDPIFPAVAYPFIEWDGQFRARYRAAINHDLGTGGTSAIRPPAETYTPVDNPANPDASTLWSADMMMRLEPTLSITEGLKLHIEADLLRNQVFGSLPVNGLPANTLRPDPSRNQASSAQFSPREAQWANGALYIGEAYGELQGFFGTFRAGRMDNHWGLGMFYNDGDCSDCDWGDSIDRIFLQSQVFGIYGALSVDFPSTGLTSNASASPLGQPYDLAQIDDVNQYTLSLSYAPQTELEIERQRKRLVEDRKPVINGGALFSWRTQQGVFADQFGSIDSSNDLVYRGLQMYIGNAFAEFLYQPNSNTSMRIALEAMGIFGSIDNATYDPVGEPENDENTASINCFNEETRGANSTECNQNSKNFGQFGLALESDFTVGGPVYFGLDAGFASGGTASNWGLTQDSLANGGDLDFFRFDPDYHVDLILFRNVIGTVTNAYYIKPHLEATFLDRGERKLRFDLAAIVSRAARGEGTPAGVENPWLGVEMDAALRFFLKSNFHASAEGGILLPMSGLSAVQGRERYTRFGDQAPEFVEDVDPSTAWAVQFNMNWNF